MKADGKTVIVIVDNLNILLNGAYSKSELDFIEIVNEFVALTERDSQTNLVLGFNRDLFDESTMAIDFYRDLKNSVFD